jgi:hypothetical protein
MLYLRKKNPIKPIPIIKTLGKDSHIHNNICKSQPHTRKRQSLKRTKFPISPCQTHGRPSDRCGRAATAFLAAVHGSCGRRESGRRRRWPFRQSTFTPAGPFTFPYSVPILLSSFPFLFFHFSLLSLFSSFTFVIFPFSLLSLFSSFPFLFFPFSLLSLFSSFTFLFFPFSLLSLVS